MNKLIDILSWSEEYLKKYSFSKSRNIAQRVISHVLKIDKINLYAEYSRPLIEEEKIKIREHLKYIAKNKLSTEEISTYLNEKEELPRDHKKENMELLHKSIVYLKKYGVIDAKLDAEYIFSKVLGVQRMMLTFNFDRELTDEEKKKIRELMVERGKKRRPLQHLLGTEEFFGYEFIVNENVLSPRPETELLVENCINLLKGRDELRILDLGTGSGAIAITLGKELPESKVLGVDLSPEALKVAKANKEKNSVKNVKFIESDMFTNVKYDKFDLIISNPPYIPESEYETLMPEVKVYEPKMALTAPNEGYYYYDLISREAPKYLKNSGILAFEVGYNQGETVKKYMENAGFKKVELVKDYENIERMVIGLL